MFIRNVAVNYYTHTHTVHSYKPDTWQGRLGYLALIGNQSRRRATVNSVPGTGVSKRIRRCFQFHSGYSCNITSVKIYRIHSCSHVQKVGLLHRHLLIFHTALQSLNVDPCSCKKNIYQSHHYCLKDI